LLVFYNVLEHHLLGNGSVDGYYLSLEDVTEEDGSLGGFGDGGAARDEEKVVDSPLLDDFYSKLT
jgi:hypothetical protein